MKIQKAIAQAEEQKRGITRESWGTNPIWIIPTNTYACMLMMLPDDKIIKRWNPISDDLTAVDWVVYG